MAVQDGTVVQMAYNLSVDGEEIESSTLEYLHGAGNIIPGLENALTDAKPGEVREVTVAPAEAYGEYDLEQVVEVSRQSFPPDFEIRIGEPMRLRDGSGHIFSGVATAVNDDTITLDLNHPMAGKELHFLVTILAVRPATEEELAARRVGGGGCAGCSGSCDDSGCC